MSYGTNSFRQQLSLISVLLRVDGAQSPLSAKQAETLTLTHQMNTSQRVCRVVCWSWGSWMHRLTADVGDYNVRVQNDLSGVCDWLGGCLRVLTQRWHWCHHRNDLHNKP